MIDRRVAANGLSIHCLEEGHPDGEPLVLLHGGGEAARPRWSPYLRALSRRFRVIAPDSRGHGGTVNPSGELTYRLMAEDTAALCEALNADGAVFCGFSDGANIALELGMRFPARCRALVLHGTAFTFSDAYYQGLCQFFGVESRDEPANVENMERSMPELMAGMRRWHAPQGPDHWLRLLRQLEVLFKTPVSYGPEDWAQVTAPALVLTGDRDPFMPVEEQVELYRLLPQAELAVWPGVGHAFPKRAELFTDLLVDFVDRRAPSPA